MSQAKELARAVSGLAEQNEGSCRRSASAAEPGRRTAAPDRPSLGRRPADLPPRPATPRRDPQAAGSRHRASGRRPAARSALATAHQSPRTRRPPGCRRCRAVPIARPSSARRRWWRNSPRTRPRRRGPPLRRRRDRGARWPASRLRSAPTRGPPGSSPETPRSGRSALARLGRRPGGAGEGGCLYRPHPA